MKMCFFFIILYLDQVNLHFSYMSAYYYHYLFTVGFLFIILYTYSIHTYIYNIKNIISSISILFFFIPLLNVFENYIDNNNDDNKKVKKKNFKLYLFLDHYEATFMIFYVQMLSCANGTKLQKGNAIKVRRI